MAKRYFSYESVLEIFNASSEVLVNFKPGGTLGSHFMQITLDQVGLKVRGGNFSKADKGYDPIEAKYVLNYSKKPPMEVYTEWKLLKPNHTLGYDCGSLWTMCPVEEIKCPLTRILREKKLSKNLLHPMDDIYALDCADNETRYGGLKYSRSHNVVIQTSGYVYNTAGLWKRWTISEIFYDKKLSRKELGEGLRKYFDESSSLEEIFGKYENRFNPEEHISHISKNPYFVGVKNIGENELTIQFKTGEVNFYYTGNHFRNASAYSGNAEYPEHAEVWEGSGYSGGHNSVHASTSEHTEQMASLIQEGYNVCDLTSMGNTSGYYPRVAYWK